MDPNKSAVPAVAGVLSWLVLAAGAVGGLAAGVARESVTDGLAVAGAGLGVFVALRIALFALACLLDTRNAVTYLAQQEQSRAHPQASRPSNSSTNEADRFDRAADRAAARRREQG